MLGMEQSAYLPPLCKEQTVFLRGVAPLFMPPLFFFLHLFALLFIFLLYFFYHHPACAHSIAHGAHSFINSADGKIWPEGWKIAR